MSEDKIYTSDDFGGPEKCCHYCLPAGIGDISWVYTKLKSFREKLGKEIIVSVASASPGEVNRGGDLIKLLPNVHWGGYMDDRNSWQVISQSLPFEWPMTVGGIGLVDKPWVQNLSANIYLESGRPLADWFKPFPMDYHYTLNFTGLDAEAQSSLMSGLPRPIIGVYVSNRAKDQIKSGGWNLWSEQQWIDFLTKVYQFLGQGSFVFLGAEYDRDKTEIVANEMEHRAPCRKIIGQELSVALYCMQFIDYGFYYPSGIGILSDVFNKAGLMLLPWILKGLETSYADPVNLAYNRYRAWANPKPDEAFDWFAHVSSPISLPEWCQ